MRKRVSFAWQLKSTFVSENLWNRLPDPPFLTPVSQVILKLLWYYHVKIIGVLVAPLGRKICSFVSENRKSCHVFLKCKKWMEISVTIILRSVVSTLCNLSQNYYSWFPLSCPFTKVFVKARVLMIGKADVRRVQRELYSVVAVCY